MGLIPWESKVDAVLMLVVSYTVLAQCWRSHTPFWIDLRMVSMSYWCYLVSRLPSS